MLKLFIQTVLLVITGVTFLPAKAQPSQRKTLADSIQQVNPPLQNFYAKYLDCDGIPIRCSAVVDDRAMVVAAGKLRMMLKDIPAVRQNLILNGAELHIIGRYEATSDLPEFADQKGVKYMDNGTLTDIDTRTRGMGALAASCGEENLLHLPGDKYAHGYDICVHEFSHTLMNYGLDSTLRVKIKNSLEHARSSNLWKNAYASTNEFEYWAELTTWYFGFRGDFLPGTSLPAPGRAGLMSYDTVGYQLLDSIYTGKLKSNLINKQTIIVYKGAVSNKSTTPAEFSFVNSKTTPVKLFWIDYNGAEKLITTIPPKGSLQQKTFATHVWRFEYQEQGVKSLYLRVFPGANSIAMKD